jgi:FkbM family methyltransferase
MRIVRALAHINLLPIWKREITVWGNRLRAASLDRLVCLALHRAGLMGKQEKLDYERWIKPGMVVVDVGANQGLYTLLYSQLVGPAGKVVAFEPEPDMYESLVHNCRINGTTNVECRRLALGARTGRAMLSRSLVHGGDNRMAAGHNQELAKAVPVEVMALDDVITTGRVDFIKMDVQGWEREVFHGMERLIAANPQLQIYFEFWPSGLRNAGCNPPELLEYLTSQGFLITEPTGGRDVPLANCPEFRHDPSGHRFTNLYAKRSQFSSSTNKPPSL